MNMRSFIDIVAEAAPDRNGQMRQAFGHRWWINARTGAVRAVEPDSNTHGDMLLADPHAFGVADQDIQTIKDRFSDEPDADEMIADDIIYVAMSRGWVRAGTGEHDGLDAPFAYGAGLRDVQRAAKWMSENGFVVDALNIEILDPEIPMVGNGDFHQLRGASLDRFLRTGRP